MILVNSNPATIMTDPEFATATYVEPLLPGPVAKIIEKERPDALLPTLGGQTALNLAMALARGRHPGALRGRADRRRPRGDPPRRGPRAVPPDDERGGAADPLVDHGREPRRGRGGAGRGQDHAAGDRPARLHDGRPGRRRGGDRDRAAPGRLRGPRREPDQPGPGRGVGARLGRVRARGDARPQRQRRDHLLDRERRPDGGPHRRLGHRRPRPDPDRRPLPGAARPGDPRDPRDRGRDRRLQRPVRRQPRERRDRRDRDEPAGLALLGPGLEGDRLPDREDGRQARGRLRAGGDPQRHHPGDAGLLRADDRLRRDQDPALRLREVPRRDRAPLDPHAERRRGDVDRPHLPRVLRQGAALARARLRRRSSPRPTRTCSTTLERPCTERFDLVLEAFRRGIDVEAVHERCLVDRWFLRELEALAARGRRHRGADPHLQGGRHLRRRVRGGDALLLLGPRAARGRTARRLRGAPRRPRLDRHPRRRPEPDRPGDRVRLLLRARGDDRARARPRRGDDQLQPGDGLDRLRHLRPPLLRAADRGGRDRGLRAGAARRA